jgi:hypothetical protein
MGIGPLHQTISCGHLGHIGHKLGRIFAGEGAALNVGLEEGVKVTGQIFLGDPMWDVMLRAR